MLASTIHPAPAFCASACLKVRGVCRCMAPMPTCPDPWSLLLPSRKRQAVQEEGEGGACLACLPLFRPQVKQLPLLPPCFFFFFSFSSAGSWHVSSSSFFSQQQQACKSAAMGMASFLFSSMHGHCLLFCRFLFLFFSSRVQQHKYKQGMSTTTALSSKRDRGIDTERDEAWQAAAARKS